MSEKKNNYLIIITTIVCLLPIIFAWSLYDKLPQQIPIHFDVAGNANNHLPKAIFVFVLPIVFSILNIYVHFMLNNDPKRANSSEIVKMIVRWSVPIGAVSGMTLSIFISLGYNPPISVIMTSMTGVLIIICGNYLPKSRQNYTIGVNLPWTLNSEDNWNKTHRLAGILWIIGGLFIVVSSFLQFYSILFIIFTALLLIAIPFIYSYVLYKRGV